jgi:hypothetical protein
MKNCKIYGQGKKGLLYFARNPAFPHLTKIGMTTKLDVEDRGLSSSNVPDAYEYDAVFECDDADWAEREIHIQFREFRHYRSNGSETEFFWTGCIQEAIQRAESLKGTKNVTVRETDQEEVLDDSGKKKIIRRPNKDFYSMGLKDGDEIFFLSKPEVKAKIYGHRLVTYKGSGAITITAAAKLVFDEYNLGQAHLGGFEYFSVDGKETLYERYNRMEAEGALIEFKLKK